MGELLFSPDAFDGVARSDAERIIEKVQWLWDNRRLLTHHPLRHQLTGYYKRVVGKYRIVYQYDLSQDNILICLVGTRDSIYEDAIKKLTK